MKTPRRIRCHPSRHPLYKAGHRAAGRGAVAWLHARAADMNDPHAQRILNSAALGLGSAFRYAKAPPKQKRKNPSRIAIRKDRQGRWQVKVTSPHARPKPWRTSKKT